MTTNHDDFARPSLPDHLEYAGFWIRFAASIVDTVLLLVVMVALGYAFFDTNPLDAMEPVTTPGYGLFSTVLPAIVVLVFWARLQATPGKLLFRTQIVDAGSGAEPGTGQWLVRYLGYYLSALGLCLGFVWVAFDARKQGWHDKLAGTVVVRERRSAPPRP